MTDSMVERVKQQALNPEWHKATRVHDWRNHVSEKVQALWPIFTDEQKIALVEQAEERAGNEHWD